MQGFNENSIVKLKTIVVLLLHVFLSSIFFCGLYVWIQKYLHTEMLWLHQRGQNEECKCIQRIMCQKN